MASSIYLSKLYISTIGFCAYIPIDSGIYYRYILPNLHISGVLQKINSNNECIKVLKEKNNKNGTGMIIKHEGIKRNETIYTIQT